MFPHLLLPPALRLFPLASITNPLLLAPRLFLSFNASSLLLLVSATAFLLLSGDVISLLYALMLRLCFLICAGGPPSLEAALWPAQQQCELGRVVRTVVGLSGSCPVP